MSHYYGIVNMDLDHINKLLEARDKEIERRAKLLEVKDDQIDRLSALLDRALAVSDSLIANLAKAEDDVAVLAKAFEIADFHVPDDAWFLDNDVKAIAAGYAVLARLPSARIASKLANDAKARVDMGLREDSDV